MSVSDRKEELAKIEEFKKLYTENVRYDFSDEIRRRKIAREGLAKIALEANEGIAAQAREAMKVISKENDVLDLADQLVKDDKDENLLEAIRLYKQGYAANVDYSFRHEVSQRKRAREGLARIALGLNQTAAVQARKAMEVITKEGDALDLADQLVKNDKDENLLEAVRLYKQGYVANIDYSFQVEGSATRQPTAKYTSVTSVLSWKDQMFNFFDKKGARLVKKVRAKQQAMNDSDPEDLGRTQGSHRKSKKG